MIRDHVSFPPLPLPLLLPYDIYESIGRKSKVERQDSIDGVRTAGGEGERDTDDGSLIGSVGRFFSLSKLP